MTFNTGVVALRMRHRNRTWKAPIVLDAYNRWLFKAVHNLQPHTLMPYYMGKLCRRGHDHHEGLSMRRWSDDWCVECQSKRKPEFTEGINWAEFCKYLSSEVSEQEFENVVASMLDSVPVEYIASLL